MTLPACSDSKDEPGPASGAPEAGGGPCAAPGSIDEVVTVYASAWNEPDAEARLCALQASLTPGATYIDPTIDTSTREALADSIGEFLGGIGAGGSIDQTSGLQTRDGELRFRWEFRQNGATVIRGIDYMELDEDAGQISSIRGYWDPLPTTPPEGALARYQEAVAESDATARRAALGDAAADSVVFTGPDTAEARGLDDAAKFMAPAAGATITALGTQAYPRFARTEFEVKTGDGVTHGADYLHLDDTGKITRIARFFGEFPPL